MRLGHAPMFLRLTSRVSRLLLTADLCQVVLLERSLSCGVANLEAMELACVLQKKFPRLFLAKAVNIVVTYVAGETVFLFDYALVWQ